MSEIKRLYACTICKKDDDFSLGYVYIGFAKNEIDLIEYMQECCSNEGVPFESIEVSNIKQIPDDVIIQAYKYLMGE